jgi:chromosome segregation ATPase
MTPRSIKKLIDLWSRREDMLQRDLQAAMARVAAATRSLEACAKERTQFEQEIHAIRLHNQQLLSSGQVSIEEIRRFQCRIDLIKDYLGKAQEAERIASEKYAAEEGQRKEIAAALFRLKAKCEAMDRQRELAFGAIEKSATGRNESAIQDVTRWRVANLAKQN